MARLRGKVALVTGASKGIGYAIAVGMAREGANVVVNYNTDADGARKAAKEIGALGRKSLVFQADVSQQGAVKGMVQAGVETFGKIDVLVNNAGIAIWKPFLEISEDVWDRTLAVNLKGAFLCTQEVARVMIEKKLSGAVINISSIAAHGALDCLVPYSASKGGMTLFTQAVAVELAPYRIRVNAVAPGTIAIERNYRTDPNYPDNWLPYIPLGRVGQVEDIAAPVIFLASGEASYITGQTLYVAGGELAYVPMPRADFARRDEV